jgi:hypothetical protein
LLPQALDEKAEPILALVDRNELGSAGFLGFAGLRESREFTHLFTPKV